MKLMNLFAGAAVLAFSLPGYAKASNYFVNMTELSGGELSVAWSLPDYGSFSGTVSAATGLGEEAWDLSSYVQITGVNVFAESADGKTWIPTIYWHEPGDSGEYNVFAFYIHNAGQFVQVYSDLTPAVISSYIDSGFLGRCGSGGVGADCPVLQNGQTESGIPLIDGSFQSLGTMDVTFTDLGDVATTPLPSTWLMLLSGLVGLSILVCRGKKKPTAFATA